MEMTGWNMTVLKAARSSEYLIVCCCFWWQIMAKRDELLLHQEVKLRNKLVEYLTDWVLPSAEHHQSIPLELSGLSK